jgi:RNA polymerase sigma-70 factor (ECF subfamily)
MTDDVFIQLGPLLFTIAYEILGSASEAEDVLQDSYLRWHAVDRSAVANPRSYLARTVTRQALNHLRTARRRREDYVGTWLPEPIRTQPDLLDDVVLAESVSFAMLLVLETLGPDERAVFVLHDVFGYTHREVGELVGKTEVAVRQVAHRAREHVQARRVRHASDPDEATRIIASFLLAARTGDLQTLMDLLAPDVVQISDGGGKVSAARRPVTGRERVARMVIGVAQGAAADLRVEFDTYNAVPAVRFTNAGGVDSVVLFAIEQRLIHAVYVVLNPDKLAAAGQPADLTRSALW